MSVPLAAAMLLATVASGIDHVPIAVNDLDVAAAAYRRLGFALKPGRPPAAHGLWLELREGR